MLKRHGVPFTIYLPTSFMEHQGELWWLVLEHTIRTQNERVTASIAGQLVHFDCSTAQLKREAYDEIYWWLRSLPETELRAYVRDLSARHGIDFRDICRNLCMDWDEVRALGRRSLVTFGAHTVDHLMLAKFPEEEARRQMIESRRRVEAELGRPGPSLRLSRRRSDLRRAARVCIARDLGFQTAVTTRPGFCSPITATTSRPCRGSRSTAIPVPSALSRRAAVRRPLRVFQQVSPRQCGVSRPCGIFCRAPVARSLNQIVCA